MIPDSGGYFHLFVITSYSIHYTKLYEAQYSFVQGHGDYHLKNILIGHDNPDDRDTTFAAVIDFDSSMCMPPAFDVGTFLAQYRNQLLSYNFV